MIGLRVIVAFACGVDICLVILLFRQVGRWFIPRWEMRLLMVSGLLVTATIGISNLQHVHRSPTWYTIALGVGMVLKAAAMVGLVQWYASPRGHKHIDAMLASVAAQEKLVTTTERRVDRLVVAVNFIFTVVLFTLLVIGVSSYRTGRIETRTHSALCTFRADLEARVDTSRRLLANNRGIFIYGIPRSVVVTNLHNQLLALRSLNALDC